jgi:hypothetical protein
MTLVPGTLLIDETSHINDKYIYIIYVGLTFEYDRPRHVYLLRDGSLLTIDYDLTCNGWNLVAV